jgi:polyribonucleotide nucleotidyltransferase
MFNVHRVQKEIGGKLITLETGGLRVRLTCVLASAARPWFLRRFARRRPRGTEIDYFPQSVDIVKNTAPRQVSLRFMKREGRLPQRSSDCPSIDRRFAPCFRRLFMKSISWWQVITRNRQYPDVLAMMPPARRVPQQDPFHGLWGLYRSAE